ncbi:MAG: hypothetical protein J5706_03150 [Elusimicrobiales bacterium]|nr:hypothetical protein [Elusimicrobiales bacterium]
MKTKSGKIKPNYRMDFIKNKNVFKAVLFACKMIKEGKRAEHAIYVASTYYEVLKSEVAHYVGQRGGRSR